MTEPIDIPEMHPAKLELPADAPPEPPALPPTPQPTVLLGRARLQAALDAVTTGPVRRLPTRQAGPSQQPAATTASSRDTAEAFYALFQTEGWQAFKALLKQREEGYLVRLRNVAAPIEEVRICQGALFEIAFLLNEERRLQSLANKTPTTLTTDLSAVQEGRAP